MARFPKSKKETRSWGRTQVCQDSGNAYKPTRKESKSEKGKEKRLSDQKKRKEYREYELFSQGSEMICKVRVGKKEVEALIDTGSEVSLMKLATCEELKLVIGSLEESDLIITQANGQEMPLKGMCWLPVEIEGMSTWSKFYIAPNLDRELILGEDWLKKNQAQIRFKPNLLTIKGLKIPLGRGTSRVMAVYSEEDVELPARTAIAFSARLDSPENSGGILYQIIPRNKSLLENEVMVVEALVERNDRSQVPVMLANLSNKTVNVPKGVQLGTVLNIKTQRQVRNVKTRPCSDGKTIVNPDEIRVPQEHRRKIEHLIYKNREVVANTNKELGQTQTIQMKIDTGDHPPIKLRPYRTPIHKRKLVEEEVKDMLECGIIERSQSPWSFPIVLVDKKDGGHRFCVDFRALNNITKPLAYPLPLIDDILSLLGRATYFSTLDLRSGYWQVALDEADREKATFACHAGLFQFRVMPFGLANASGIFQQLMSIVLEGLENFSMAYLDDIIIFSSSVREHLQHLQAVFERLKSHGLKLKLPKCQFMNEETRYLGFVINKNGIKPDSNKIEVIRSMPEPKTVRQVRRFIGAIGQYRRFIPAFSSIATPLIELTKKHAKFKWSEESQRSFEALKDQLTAIPLLIYPDLSKPMVLYTDASDQCIGACLTQPCSEKEGLIPGIPEETPIYFLSHKLSSTEQRWSVIEKEAYAIIYALQKLDYLLRGATFIIKTDHKPLQYLFKADWKNKKIQQWALRISEYNCKIEYLSARENTFADLLSRIPNKLKLESEKVKQVDDKVYQINVLNSHNLEDMSN